MESKSSLLPSDVAERSHEFFGFYGLPYELKRFVLEKVNPDTFGKLFRSSKPMKEECDYLKRKPILSLRSLQVKRKETRGLISRESEKQNTIDWQLISACGYRVTIGTFAIETARPERVQEAVTILQKALSVGRLEFRNGFQDIPVGDVRQLIKAGNSKKILFLENLRAFRFGDLALKNKNTTYIFQCGYGFTDEDFLSHDASLQIYYGSLISASAIITKIKQWKGSAIIGQHFFLSRHASFEDTLELQIPQKIGAIRCKEAPHSINFKELWDEKVQYDIILNKEKKLVIELKGTHFSSEICCIVVANDENNN